jgi:hypothetical protein
MSTVLSSDVGDGAVKVTCLRCDVDAESCWRWCCRVMLAMVTQLKVVLAVVRFLAPELGASKCCRSVKKSDIHVCS